MAASRSARERPPEMFAELDGEHQRGSEIILL